MCCISVAERLESLFSTNERKGIYSPQDLCPGLSNLGHVTTSFLPSFNSNSEPGGRVNFPSLVSGPWTQ